MPNFVKTSLKMIKLSIQVFSSDRSVCIAALCYSVSSNEQLLSEKRRGVNFQIDISKTKGLYRIYTDGQTDRHGQIDLVRYANHSYIYFIRSLTFPFGC